MWKLQRGDEQGQVGVVSYFSANEATVLLHAALAGGGIALQPTYLASGALVAVLPEWRAPAMMVYALYLSRRHLSPAVRTLLDFLVDRFCSLPW